MVSSSGLEGAFPDTTLRRRLTRAKRGPTFAFQSRFVSQGILLSSKSALFGPPSFQGSPREMDCPV